MLICNFFSKIIERVFLYKRHVSELPDEGADGPGGSPKVAALPPTLKRALPEKDAQSGLQSAGSANRSTQDGELAPPVKATRSF